MEMTWVGVGLGFGIAGFAMAAFLGTWLSRRVAAALLEQRSAWDQWKQELPRSLGTELGGALRAPVGDLLERFTKSHAELREGMSERISQGLLANQERIERALAHGRAEQKEGLTQTTQALEGRFKTLEGQVTSRLDAIGKNVETKLGENLKEGFKHFEKVQQHLAAAELKLASLSEVGRSISDLNNLLKLPHLRGGFGEATLERLLADFLPVGAYETQFAVTPGSTERVDAIVRLGRQILPIDSKFPREQVLPLFTTDNPAELEKSRAKLSEVIRGQAKSIADKYIKPEHGTTDQALLFLPSETLYFEVIRDVRVFEELSRLKVFPVSPNTLVISLKAVAVAQDYYELARGVEKTIEDVQKARKHFENFDTRFQDVGKGLRKAQEAYDTANTHLGRYESSIVRLVGDEDSAARSADLVDNRGVGPEIV